MKVIRLKNWERFQHYKNRTPPWIKLYNDMLSSETWVSASDASRVLMIACMLLASRTQNAIPANPQYLKRVAYLNEPPDFSELIALDFLEIVDENGVASNVLADCYQPAITEESRGEKRREEKRIKTLARSANALQAVGSGEKRFEIPSLQGDVAICETAVQEWSELFPAVDVEQTLREIRAWSIANPAKRKTSRGVPRFVTSWLTREQNRG